MLECTCNDRQVNRIQQHTLCAYQIVDAAVAPVVKAPIQLRDGLAVRPHRPPGGSTQALHLHPPAATAAVVGVPDGTLAAAAAPVLLSGQARLVLAWVLRMLWLRWRRLLLWMLFILPPWLLGLLLLLLPVLLLFLPLWPLLCMLLMVCWQLLLPLGLRLLQHSSIGLCRPLLLLLLRLILLLLWRLRPPIATALLPVLLSKRGCLSLREQLLLRAVLLLTGTLQAVKLCQLSINMLL